MADARDKATPARPRKVGESVDRAETVGARTPDSVRVPTAEGGRIGVDDDVAGRARYESVAVVHDRATRAEQWHRAIRLLVRVPRVLLAVQDLDRPRPQQEQRKSGSDDDRQTADPDIEARAAEIRRVDARVRLGPAASGQ